MFTSNEARPRGRQSGGVLLELILVVFLLAALASSGLRVHDALARRFRAIVAERNEAILAARAP